MEVKISKWRSVEANGGQWKLHSSGAKGGCARRGKKGVGEIVLMVKAVFYINFEKRYFCRILDLQSEL